MNAHAHAEGYQLCIQRTEQVRGQSDGGAKSHIRRFKGSGKVFAVCKTVRKRSRSSQKTDSEF